MAIKAKDLAALREQLRADRVARRMTWARYAAHLEVPLSTLNKLVRNVTRRPHELTVSWLVQKLAEHGPVAAG